MRSSKSWGPAVSTLSSGVSLLLGVAQTAMLLRLEGSDRVLEAQTLHMVTALESTLSELVEIRRDMASWRARAPPVVAVQEQAAADIDIEIEDASYPEPDHEPFWPSAAEEIPEPALRFEAESWDPNCFDVRTTGLSLECKDLGPHCGKGSSAPAIRAMCPRACNMTCDDFCRDLEFTTFQEPDGSMSSCRHLRLNCQDWESGERVRRICPVTCGICPGAPLSPPGLEEEAIFRLLTNGTKALERALRSTGAKPPRYLHRIPPILHQTWKTDLIPAKYGADISSWLRLHPTWRYEFWDDARGAALVLDEIPEYAAAFKQMSGIKRADVVRIVALHAFGGVYADIDVEAAQPFDRLLDAAEASSQAVLLGEENVVHSVLLEKRLSGRLVSNAVMASVPKHPFWLEVLQEIFTRKDCGSDPVQCTGPRLIDRLSLQRMRRQPGCARDGCVARLPFDFFSPQLALWNAGNMAKACSDYGRLESLLSEQRKALLMACGALEHSLQDPAVLRTPRSFAVHRWQCSWCREDDSMRAVIPLSKLLWQVGNETLRPSGPP